MVYPTLLAVIGDVAHPSWRASAVGVYRLWRDLGYAVGAVLAGATAGLLRVGSAGGLRPAPARAHRPLTSPLTESLGVAPQAARPARFLAQLVPQRLPPVAVALEVPVCEL